MSNFKVCHNATRIYMAPMKLDPRSQFVFVLPNEYANNTVVNFTIIGIAMGAPIRTPRNEELDTFPVYEITSPYFGTCLENFTPKMKWIQNRLSISVVAQMIIDRGDRHGGKLDD